MTRLLRLSLDDRRSLRPPLVAEAGASSRTATATEAARAVLDETAAASLLAEQAAADALNALRSEDEVGTASGTLAFGAIGASYATLLTMIGACKILTVINATDAILAFSFDGVTPLYLPSASFRILDFWSARLTLSTNVTIKHLGVAPTLGAAYADAII